MNRAANGAHVIVFGNEKGGTGKSTTAMHVAIALAAGGSKVATIDLDARQKTLARSLENRRNYIAKHGLQLALPESAVIDGDDPAPLDDQIGRAHVCTPFNNAPLVCPLLL